MFARAGEAAEVFHALGTEAVSPVNALAFCV